MQVAELTPAGAKPNSDDRAQRAGLIVTVSSTAGILVDGVFITAYAASIAAPLS